VTQVTHPLSLPLRPLHPTHPLTPPLTITFHFLF
jgi:hypothetical protein